MPLAATGDIVTAAYRDNGPSPAFNAIQLEHAAAVVTAAERQDRPVILQLSQNAVRYHGGLAPIGSALLATAHRARTPVAVHLDHAESAELVGEAVELGFSSVMFDASTLDYEDNVRATADVVRYCRKAGVWVEAELGEVGGKDGVHAPGARTDPDEAVRFVTATGVDALAVAVGSSHAMLTREAVLDLELIGRLRAASPVPLVLHGSSGVDDENLRAAVHAGLTKINIATQLNKAFTAGVREHLAENPDSVDPRKYLARAREAVTDETARLMAAIDPAAVAHRA